VVDLRAIETVSASVEQSVPRGAREPMLARGQCTDACEAESNQCRSQN
jgi:hypothetical protein